MTVRPAVLERLFQLREAGTTIRTELMAGATTFATLSYITFVQPAVLAGAGMDFGAVIAATCVASGFATALMGLAANYPIAVAPAMGHNFSFVYAVTQLGLPWPVALGTDFLAGALFILLAAFRFREAVIHAIPDHLKAAIPVGIGLLIAFVGMRWGGIVVANPGSLVRLGRLTAPATLLALGGFVLIAVLHLRRVPGAILIGMLVTTVTGAMLCLLRYQGVIGRPPSLAPTLLKLDVLGALRPEYLEVVLLFLVPGRLRHGRDSDRRGYRGGVPARRQAAPSRPRAARRCHGSAGRLLSGVPVVGPLIGYPERPWWGPLDMSARPSTPVCEIPGCGKPAAVVMRAPAEVPGKEHSLCPAHASWIALRLGRVGVTYTSRPLAAA